MMSIAPDSRFELLLAAMRWPMDGARLAMVARLVERVADWPAFLELIRRHRVAPLVARALLNADRVLPADIGEVLRDASRRAHFSEMISVTEVARLTRLLRDQGIGVLLLKGPTLSLRAFAQLGLRTYRDLDLLIAEDQLAAANALLHADNYEAIEPPAAAALDLRTWTADHKDMVLRHRTTGTILELHWRLFDNQRLMPASALGAPERLGIAPLAEAMVLSPMVEFRYLCLHGALHGWSRLRWLADVNAIVSGVDPAGLVAFVGLKQGRLDPAVAQALILCRDLLGAPFPPEVDIALRRSRRGRWLARIAWAEILRSGPAELEDTPFGSTIKNLSHYLLLDDGRALLAELRFDLTVQPRVERSGDKRGGRLAGWIGRHRH